MDFLQIALIFLILLLSIFLGITGIQVFFILRDLKKALDKLNAILHTGENIAGDIERPLSSASNLVATLGDRAKDLAGVVKRESKHKQRRFYKRTL